tara:strand:- start:2598 stop:2798 length:201 start_codon:yes stop_codon:yes gene_type:complete
MPRFGDEDSLIAFYEYQLERYLQLGIGESTYEEGYNYSGIAVSQELITATRRRLIQLRLKKKTELK